MTEREREEIRQRYESRQLSTSRAVAFIQNANTDIPRLLDALASSEPLASSERKLEEARGALDKMRKACREEEMEYFEDIALIADAVLDRGPETTLPGDDHPLDESLGNLHVCALALELMGLTDWALKLAHAHEKIQTYLMENEPDAPQAAVTASMDPAQGVEPTTDEALSHDLMMEVQSQISTILEMHDFEPCGAIEIAQEATKKAWDAWDRQARQIADLKAQVERLTQELAVWTTESEYATAVNAALTANERAEEAKAVCKTWEWAVGAKDKQLLEFSDTINERGEQIAKLTGERDAVRVALRKIHDALTSPLVKYSLGECLAIIDAVIAKEPV